MTQTNFQHQQAAHCESGVVSALLNHEGLPMTEAMAFGLSSVISFAYIPFIKLNGLPLFSFRLPPKFIIKGIQSRLGVKFKFQKFKTPTTGTVALEKALANNKLVGLQGSVFWLPYFPEDMRFHFNAHNMLAYGKNENQFLISDPIFEEAVEITAEDLERSRFAKGAMAAKGLMYTIEYMPSEINYEQAIIKAIRKSCKIMLKTPLPTTGIKGVYYVAKKISKLDKQLKDELQIKLWLGHIIRMQEEIGTGGAGFRFIYASFLQEAGKRINDPVLLEAASEMTTAGDQWRQFALAVAKTCKGRKALDLNQLSQELHRAAELEEAVWHKLDKHC